MSAGRGPRPVRVAVLDHTAQLGGAELALVRMLTAMPPGYDVHVLLLENGPLVSRLQEAAVPVEILAVAPDIVGLGRQAAWGPAGLRSALRLVPSVLGLARHVRSLEVDLIHTTSLKANLLGVAVAALTRKPLVWHVHDRIADDYLPGAWVRLLRLLARRVPRRVVANSLATARTLPGAKNLIIAHPGLAPNQVAREPRPDPAGPPVVGLVGRISPTKGQLDFVRAARLVLEALPEAQFRLIGAASFGHEAYERAVRDEVDRLGLSERVAFAGFVPDPAAEIDRLAVCVHAATVPEPFGQVVAEAMARGTPVVATSGGGVDEILAPDDPDNGPLGLLVPSGDMSAMADAIVHVLTHAEQSRARAWRAWSAVRERYPIEKTARIVTKVWSDVAAQGAVRTRPCG